MDNASAGGKSNIFLGVVLQKISFFQKFPCVLRNFYVAFTPSRHAKCVTVCSVWELSRLVEDEVHMIPFVYNIHP